MSMNCVINSFLLLFIVPRSQNPWMPPGNPHITRESTKIGRYCIGNPFHFNMHKPDMQGGIGIYLPAHNGVILGILCHT